MASLRDIRRRIRSVSSTRQITHTMEMVSTTKIMRALQTAAQAAPYKDAIKTMLATVAPQGALEGEPLLMEHAHLAAALIIAVASDRGLAGGFNVQVQRSVTKRLEEFGSQGVACTLITCGKKPTEYFRYQGIEPALCFEGLSAEPTYAEASQIASFTMDGFTQGSFDFVEIWYQHAKSRVEQELTQEQLLPVTRESLRLPNEPRHEKALSPVKLVHSTVFSFEPSAKEVLGYLIPAYVRTVIHHALIDSAAAEHGARRRAMQAATENADEIIQHLSREYNRIRQGSITTELNEIVSGAQALEEL